VACAVASLIMVRARPATDGLGVDGETREIEVAGDAA